LYTFLSKIGEVPHTNFKSQPAKSKSQLANTKVSRQLAGEKGEERGLVANPLNPFQQKYPKGAPSLNGAFESLRENL